MKLAIVDHIGNFGGGSRVVRGLLHGFAAAPGLRITYFCNPASLRREGMREELDALRIDVVELQSVRLAAFGVGGIKGSGYVLGELQSRFLDRLAFLPPFLSGSVATELERRLKGFDLAYFSWPYLLKRPDLACPAVATFHDFNFRYFFGSHIYTPRQLSQLESQIPDWLDGCFPVVSSDFMAAELHKFYPRAAARAAVIRFASPSAVDTPPRDAAQTVDAMGVRGPYALYPANACPHKNIGALVSAFAMLRERGVSLPLVLTGPGTQSISGQATPAGIRLGAVDANVIGLGYVSNAQVDALIANAAVVVSSSLYEAGNGPGLDAWALGTPVAMSDIPAFVEHLGYLGVKASVFNPRDPADIADKIEALVRDPQAARAEAELSRRAMARYGWRDCAAQYLQVFERAVGN